MGENLGGGIVERHGGGQNPTSDELPRSANESSETWRETAEAEQWNYSRVPVTTWLGLPPLPNNENQ